MWQLPHFLAISLYQAEDYKKADIKVYPNIKGIGYTKLVIFISCIVMVLSSVLPVYFGLSSRVYLMAALAMGLIFIWVGAQGFRLNGDSILEVRWAKKCFFASIIYLPLLFGAMIVFK